MITDSKIKESNLHDITHFGIRLVLGPIFIYHGIAKFNPEVSSFFTSVGIPAELRIPIALAESIGGILLISGVLTRISSSIISIILLGGIFLVKGIDKFSGSGFTGWEFDVMLLAGALLTIASGPGRISISQIVKKIPRFLQ